jgi:hypothetical protein
MTDNQQTAPIDSLYQLDVISGVKLGQRMLKGLRNALFEKYYPDIYSILDPHQSSKEWEVQLSNNPIYSKFIGLREERRSGHVVYFPKLSPDEDDDVRLLTYRLDSCFDNKPFILIGVVTMTFDHQTYRETGQNQQKALSGCKIEQVDCRKTIRSFLSEYYSDIELDSIMDTYGTYVFDFLS